MNSEKDMLPVQKLADSKETIRFVLTDIDDTLTDQGKIKAPTYAAIWRLYEAGYILIPVTGRPAGWCDLIIRQWPVHAVVGENGAFVYFTQKDGVSTRIQSLYHPEADEKGTRQRIEDLRERVLAEIPGSRVARDQFARQFDLAIDFREDLPDLGFDTAERIRQLCVSQGAEAKISSIHVNAWFGRYDKLSMTKIFLEKVYGLNEEEILSQVLFIGDSPNDQPMFGYFPYSCGVANLKEMLSHISSPPTYIASARGGAGFAEIAAILLSGPSES